MQAIADPSRVIAYLVTTADEAAMATAKYLWGGAQQVGLTVGGLILNRGAESSAIADAFAPLPLTALPDVPMNDWQPLLDALPDFTLPSAVPPPLRSM